METLLSFSAIAVGVIVGLAAWVQQLVSQSSVVSSWRAQLVNQKWHLCCRLKCSSSPVCWMQSQ